MSKARTLVTDRPRTMKLGNLGVGFAHIRSGAAAISDVLATTAPALMDCPCLGELHHPSPATRRRAAVDDRAA